AAARHGGADALGAAIVQHRPKSTAELAAIPDDRWLAAMSKRVFCAGFNWSVIDNKWPGFEEAFHGCDVRWCPTLPGEDCAALIREGVIDKPPSAKRAYCAIQAAFNAWAAESGRDLPTISRTLAMSIDG